MFLLQEGKLQEAVESLLSLEKQTRTVSVSVEEVLLVYVPVILPWKVLHLGS